MLTRTFNSSWAPRALAVTVLSLFGYQSAAAQTGYAITKIADAANVANVAQAGCFAVNGQGTVVFTTSDGIVWRAGTDGPTRLAEPGAAGQPLTTTCPGLNDAGDVTYAFATPSYTALVKQSGGGSLTELARSDAAPYLATTMSLGVHSLSNGGASLIAGADGMLYIVPSATPVFTQGAGDPPLSGTLAGTMNDNGVAAFYATRVVAGVTRAGIYRANGSPLVEDGGTLVPLVLAARPVVNANSVVAFLGRLADGSVHVLSTTDGVAFVDHSGSLASAASQSFSINSAGRVAFVAPTQGAGFGIFVGQDAVNDKVIAPGDALDGSTVVSVRMSNESLNDLGHVAFWAELADGRSGVYVARPILAPVASSGPLATTINTAVSGMLPASDPLNLPLTYSITTNGSRGTAAITNSITGAFTYTPNSNAIGTDTFTFQVTNGYISSNIGTVTVTIAPGSGGNRPPVAVAGGSAPATSIRFDSVNDELYRTTNLPSITNFTMMGWFRFLVDDHTYSSFMRFGSNTNSLSYNIEMCCGNGWNDLYLWTGTGGGLYQVVRKITKGAWYHLAVTVEGTGTGQVKVYLNGGAPFAYPGNPNNIAGRFSMGTTHHGEYLNGNGADVKLYNAVLTRAEIQQEMAQFTPLRMADLNAFYPLQSVENATLDYSGNDRHLTQRGVLATDTNGPPIQAGNPLVVNEDGQLTGIMSASDPDGNPLTFTLVTNGTKGVAVITNPTTGAYTYVPHPNMTGSDVIAFKANDGLLDSNVAQIAITIAPVNDAPVTVNGTASVFSGSSVNGTLQASDLDGNPLTYALVANGAKGTAVITNVATGAYTYTAGIGSSGTDTFTFRASDATLSSNVATVTVTITPGPIASDGTLGVTEDIAASGQLLASDPGGLPLTYSIVTNGTRGSALITNTSTGAFVYTPALNAAGPDAFTFLATNGAQTTNIATVTVAIAPVNDAPVAANGLASVLAGSSVLGALAATDVDNTTRTFSIVTNGTKGTATITNTATGAYTYVAAANSSGTDSFTFRANDGSLDSNVATVTITITATVPANNPPVAVPAGSSPATSVRFDASTDELSRTTALPSVTNFTMMGWFRYMGDDHTYSTFMRLGHATNSYGYNLQLCCGNGWDDLYMFTGTGGGLYQVVRRLTKGAWYHFAVTVEGTGAGQVKVFVNGGAPFAYPGNPGVVAQKFWIGNSQSGAWLDGSAAAVKVYDTVLTQAEIGQEMNQFEPVRTANLNSFYALQSAETATLDSSGNGRTLTSRGSLVTDPSGPPLQAGSPLTTPTNTALTGTLQATDPNGDPLTFTLATPAANGTAVVISNGTFIYTPNAGYVGNDSFTFSVSDGLASSSASVRIAIGP